MGLSGSLRTLSLAEICQTLNRSQATGILRLSSPIGGRDLVFDAGEVIQIRHRGESAQHSLLHRLMAMGLIPGDTPLPKTGAGSGGYSTIETLVQGGQLDGEQANEALHQMVQDEFVNVFTWTSANFLFREASESDAEACQIVAEARTHPVQTLMSSLLMEAARREDEWQEIREYLPSDDDVPVVVAGRDQDLAAHCTGYPDRPVAALITGYHSFEDIYRLAPVPRMDVQFVFYDLMSEGLVKILSVDEMVALGQQFLKQRQQAQAAQLFRRALALDRGREDVMAMLAHCLELLGNSPDASGCYSQLALTYLAEGRGLEAVAMARRANELSAADSQTLVLVRCLLDIGNEDEAVGELVELARRQANDGALDEARSTCRKALDIRPDHDEARRELARIVRLAGEAGMGDEIVVCIECGETNEREAETCGSCGASLQTTCLACSRIVAASDHICIFCGSDPHDAQASSDRRQSLSLGPDTDTIISGAHRTAAADGIDTASWQSGLRQRVAKARDLEEKLRYQEALAIWKELAGGEVDNADLDRHIRDLEGLVHDREIERFIERGHAFRDRRAFYRAAGFYRRALRCMADDDPRHERLQEFLDACNRSHRMAALAYLMAIVFLGFAGWLVVEPQLRRNGFLRDIAAVIAEVEGQLEAPDVGAYLRVEGKDRAFDIRATESGLLEDPEVGQEVQLLKTTINTMRVRVANVLYEQASAELDAGNLAQAESRISEIDELPGMPQVLGQRWQPMQERLAELRGRQQSVAEARKELPKRLAAAKEALAAERLQEAFDAFTALATAPVPEIAAEAGRLRDQLVTRRSAFETLWRTNSELIASDLVAAEAAWQAPDFVAEAGLWNRQADRAATLERIATTRREATAAWASLARNPESEGLETFIAAFPAAPETRTARETLVKLQRSATQRRRDLERTLEGYREAVDGGDAEGAWRAARRLFDSFPEEAAAAGVRLTTRFELGLSDVAILLDGAELGRTGTDGTWLWRHPPGQSGTLRIDAEHFEAVELEAASLDRDFRRRVVLQRQVLWRHAIGGPVRIILFRDGRLLAEAGGDLVGLGDQGAPRWRIPLGERAGLSGRSMGALVRFLPDGRLLVPTAEDEVLLIADGKVSRRVAVGMQILDAPALFVDEFTSKEQLAVVGPSLAIGTLGEAGLTRVDGSRRLRAGPLVMALDLDKQVIVISESGEVQAWRASDRERLWSEQIPQVFTLDIMQVTGPDSFVLVLDDERLVSYRVGDGRLSTPWNQPIPRGDATPATVMDGRVVVAGGGQVLAFDAADGSPVARIQVGEQLVGAAAVGAGMVCYGVATDHGHDLVVHDGRRELWRRSLPAKPVASRFTDTLVVTGLVDGTILALPR